MGFWLKVKVLGFTDGSQHHVVFIIRSNRNIRIGDVWDASQGVVKGGFRLLEGFIQRRNFIPKHAHGADFRFALLLALHPANFLAYSVAFSFFGFNVQDQAPSLLIERDYLIHHTSLHLALRQAFFYKIRIFPK